jgi:hypothetical protein
MGFLSNTIPMLNLMVVVVVMMAFFMVGASIRWSHLGLHIRHHAEKWVGDIRVYFLRWMHICWLAFGVGCRYISKFEVAGMPFSHKYIEHYLPMYGY